MEIDSGLLLDSILDSTADGILVVDRQGKILSYNARFVAMWRIPPEVLSALEDRKALDYVLGQMRNPEAFRRKVQEIYDQPDVDILDIIELKDGRSFERYTRPLRVGQESVGRVWSFRDITARRASEERYRLMVETAEEGVWGIDPSGQTQFVNGRLAEMLGFSPEEMRGRSLFTFLDDEMKQVARAALEQRARGLPGQLDLLVTRKDGSRIWIHVSGSPVRDAEGRHLGSFAMVTDITERKRMEEQLRDSRNELEALVRERTHFITSILENIPDMIFVKDAKDLRFVRFNQAGERLLGYSREEMIGKNDYDFFPKQEADFFTQKDREVLQGGRVVDIPEEPIHTRSGTRILHTRKIPIYSDEGDAIYLLGISEDITVQRQIETEKEARMKAESAKGRSDLLADVSRSLAARSLDPEKTLTTLVSKLVPALADGCVIRLSAESKLEKMSVSSHADPELIAQGKDILRVPLKAHDKTLGEISLVSFREGRFGPEEVFLAEEVAGRAALAIENAMLYQEAQAAIQVREEFISIASHELRTPLTPLTTQLQLIQNASEQGDLKALSSEKLKRLIQLSRKDLQRLNHLVENLLDTSRIGAGKMTLHIEEVDLNEIVRSAVERLRSDSAEALATIDVDYQGQIRGLFDPLRIEQVLTNLLTNAIKFGEGRPIRVSIRTDRPDSLTIRVTDQGIGIPKEDLERIFERFERAVSGGQYGGLGLGLYIARQIVRAHCGEIRAESEPGHGATFVVELPLRSKPALAA
jgi:PAS domain S-box-containing protein